jgi:membrane-bound lytic murein transglycosylase B
MAKTRRRTRRRRAVPTAEREGETLGAGARRSRISDCPNFIAAKSYNPSMTYALALVHLGDRCVGGEPFVQQFPGSERAPTPAEAQQIQRRLTALGFDTGGADGRIGTGTAIAVRNYQLKVGLKPADGYAGIKLLARLRQGA